MRWFSSLLLILTLASTASSAANAPRARGKPPSRASFERRMAAVSRDLFGKNPFQVEGAMAPDSSRTLYWGRAFVTVEYDPTGRVETVHAWTHDGLVAIEPIATRLVPSAERGRFLRRLDESDLHACQSFSIDEFESVMVGTYQYGCANSRPAHIIISWNKGTAFPRKSLLKERPTRRHIIEVTTNRPVEDAQLAHAAERARREFVVGP